MNLSVKILLFLMLTGSLWANLLDFKTIDQANEAYEKGHFQKSAILFGELKKDDPSIFYDRANALYKAKAYDEALKYYEKAKGVDESTRLHNIGNSYFQKQKLKLAIESYEKALKIREDSDTRHNLELAKRKQEEKKKNKKKKKKKKKKPKQKKDKKKKQKKNNKKNKKKNNKKKEPQKEKEAMRKRELNHMIKELSKKKMPTLMYQTNSKKGDHNEKNPW